MVPGYFLGGPPADIKGPGVAYEFLRRSSTVATRPTGDGCRCEFDFWFLGWFSGRRVVRGRERGMISCYLSPLQTLSCLVIAKRNGLNSKLLSKMQRDNKQLLCCSQQQVSGVVDFAAV